MKKIKLRNSLTVRLTDEDHDAFIALVGKNYSTTLRELIKQYIDANKSKSENIGTPPKA